ncbi:LOW QUALITY PROTEIN: uncharacterized protein LOC126905138 [Daktulosphaira vitifoliae]|uniref:LOW QUALITY PROTEIN: uncharacterized protein LOC126905138 n=1 Tax=Daktulosphaira vitifoliae TaxID=58002 RepID=UPI0021AA6589|nr:LOW QUALITY PROTEIN: uncharacterized protein LOC126905138 [Daktulosphaira vitifoliae]
MRVKIKMTNLRTLLIVICVIAGLQLQIYCDGQQLGIKSLNILKKPSENINSFIQKSSTDDTKSNSLLKNIINTGSQTINGVQNITGTAINKTMEDCLTSAGCTKASLNKIPNIASGLIDWSKSSIEDVITKAKCIIPKDANSITRAALLQQCLSPSFGNGNETRCFDGLGCFPMDNPWTSLLRPLPMPMTPDEIGTKLYLYTRNKPERYHVNLWPDISIEGSDFNSKRPYTVFITHGYIHNGNESWLSDLKDSYLKQRDANVFLVDWGRGSFHLNYLQVASNTRIVGAELARFGKYLTKQQGLDPSKVHLMGHSLGAHISSYFAKNFPGVGRITGFDPAQPGFEGCPKEVRLDKSDAELVDVIHTSCRPFIPFLGFGLIEPVGHVDLYMNGGAFQPGCVAPPFERVKVQSIADLAVVPIFVLGEWIACSHGRSFLYYNEAVMSNEKCTVWGRKTNLISGITNVVTNGQLQPITSLLKKCSLEDCIPLGLEIDQYPARGVFSASTNIFTPFCSVHKETDNIMRSALKTLNVGKKINDTTINITTEDSNKLSNIAASGLIDWSNSSIEDAIIKANCIIPKDADSITRALLLQQCFYPNFNNKDAFIIKETRCFDGLGCFPMDYPWSSVLRPLPMPMTPDEVGTKLYLYTRNQPGRYNVSIWPEISLDGSDFDSKRPYTVFNAKRPYTVFMTHGYIHNGNESWLLDLKDAYLKQRDANVFLVDWGKGSFSLNYLQVASNTRIVGAELARFGKYLAKQHGLDPSKIHLMGHSLGAHITSYFAKNFPGVGRITGFDPAQPGFEGCPKEVRLDKSDAELVDVIHTSSRPFIPFLGFGFIEPIGHVDLYMNGGGFQPGCVIPPFERVKLKNIADFAIVPISVLGEWIACSHGRSFLYYTEAVLSNEQCTVWGHRINLITGILEAITNGHLHVSALKNCSLDDCIPLGLGVDEYPARGIFSASTNRFTPFCSVQNETDNIMRNALKNSRDLITLNGNGPDSNKREGINV